MVGSLDPIAFQPVLRPPANFLVHLMLWLYIFLMLNISCRNWHKKCLSLAINSTNRFTNSQRGSSKQGILQTLKIEYEGPQTVRVN
jgi:hypothetical protein